MDDQASWRGWSGGPAPDCPKVKVRLRCQTRADAEAKEPQDPKRFKRWTHDGGPGDIIEIMEVVE